MNHTNVKKLIKQLENRSGDWDIIFSNSVSVTSDGYDDSDIEED